MHYAYTTTIKADFIPFLILSVGNQSLAFCPYGVCVPLCPTNHISPSKCLLPRRSGETIQKSAIPPTANERTFHVTTNPIAVDVAHNK